MELPCGSRPWCCCHFKACPKNVKIKICIKKIQIILPIKTISLEEGTTVTSELKL